jgi:type IX secretion system PorP/SprF family membrane protein
MFSLAYHIGIGKKGNTTFSLAGQGGIVQKRFEQSAAVTETGLQQGIPSANETFAVPTVNHPDFAAGALLHSTLSSRLNFDLGVSAAHLTTPKESFKNSDKSLLARRILAHGGFSLDMGTRWVLLPSVSYQTQAKVDEINAQAMIGRHLNAERDITLLFGGGYRANEADAAIAMVGMNYKGFKVGAAYDVNVAGLNNYTSGRGGFEIGLSYTARISKVPVVKPILFCPRF